MKAPQSQTPAAVHLRQVAAVLVLVGIAVGCSGSDAQPGNSAGGQTPQPQPTAVLEPSPTPDPEQVVLDAYFRYWEAYAEALLELDAALAEEVASGEELRRIHDEVDGLRSQGVALRVVVEHNPVVLQLGPASAVLMDEMVNNSFYVDPITKEPPVASGSGEILRDTFHLEVRNGEWVVVLSTRQR